MILPEPAGETLAIAVHTDYRRIESRSELALLDRPANHRRAGQQHHFCQIRPQQAFIEGERPEPMESFQQAHAGNIPGKNQPSSASSCSPGETGSAIDPPERLQPKRITQIPQAIFCDGLLPIRRESSATSISMRKSLTGKIPWRAWQRAARHHHHYQARQSGGQGHG